MSDRKSAQSLKNLGAALERLREALQEPETNPLVADATIQRFEFVIELYWKTLKRLLVLEQIQVHTPKEVFQQAYQANWLGNEEAWLQMLKDRNETSHLYDEAMAKQIYEHIKDFFPELQRTYGSLIKRLKT